MNRIERITELAAAVGDDGTGDLGVIIDHAPPDASLEDLIEIVTVARAEALANELREYARLTARDNECDLATAVRMMRDEPGHVAGELSTTAEVVIAWCDTRGREDGGAAGE